MSDTSKPFHEVLAEDIMRHSKSLSAGPLNPAATVVRALLAVFQRENKMSPEDASKSADIIAELPALARKVGRGDVEVMAEETIESLRSRVSVKRAEQAQPASTASFDRSMNEGMGG
jgi:hypothetical protein